MSTTSSRSGASNQVGRTGTTYVLTTAVPTSRMATRSPERSTNPVVVSANTVLDETNAVDGPVLTPTARSGSTTTLPNASVNIHPLVPPKSVPEGTVTGSQGEEASAMARGGLALSGPYAPGLTTRDG